MNSIGSAYYAGSGPSSSMAAPGAASASSSSSAAATAAAAVPRGYDQPPPGAPALPPAFYARIAAVPLLLSPALRLRPPPALPQDLHPLPLDLAPYMIYPFSLEQHVLHPDPANGGPLVEDDPLEMLQAARDFLADRAAQAERERKAALQRIAPGWAELEGRGGVLEPKRRQQTAQLQSGGSVAAASGAQAQALPSPLDDLDNLAAQMAAIDAGTRAASTPTLPPSAAAGIPSFSAAPVASPSHPPPAAAFSQPPPGASASPSLL